MLNEILLPGWEHDGDHNITRRIDDVTHLTIHKYPNSASRYCCHIIRGDFRYCPDIVYSLAAAIDACEMHLALPIAEFKSLQLVDKIEELSRLHRELIRLGHNPGDCDYAAGWRDGAQETRREMTSRLRDLVDGLPDNLAATLPTPRNEPAAIAEAA